MIHFVGMEPSIKVLKEINLRLSAMIVCELEMLESAEWEYESVFFPSYVYREKPERCREVLLELREWTDDFYPHELTCMHEYALYNIIYSYSDMMDDIESFEGIMEDRFHIRNREDFSEEELELLDSLQSGDDFIDILFYDIDFTFMDEIVHLYRYNRVGFEMLGVNLEYYMDILPKDIREQISVELKQEKEDEGMEELIVLKIQNVLEQMEVRPRAFAIQDEVMISDAIADRLSIALQEEIRVDRERPAGYSKQRTGETDFFLTRIQEKTTQYIAVGENKNWGKFESQVNQLVGYMNENMRFGFTIVIVRDQDREEVREKQIELLKEYEINDMLRAKGIYLGNNVLVSVHEHPENHKEFRMYHFILNLYHPEREEAAKKR